jgi:ubiquinone/menaquinone biosynthesis C-methylase UbiE
MQDTIIGYSSDYSLVDPEYYQKNAVEASGPQIARKIGEIITHNLPLQDGKKRVLDVASGTGIVSRCLKQLGYDVISADLNRNMLHYGVRQDPDIPTLEMDMNGNFPVRENSFDAIVTLWANRFIKDPSHFSNEAYRALKPGGILVWPIVPAEAIIWKLHAGLKSPVTAGGVRKVLEKTGFDVNHDKVPFFEFARRSVNSECPSGFLVARK